MNTEVVTRKGRSIEYISPGYRETVTKNSDIKRDFHEFYYTYTEEPHRTRRDLIIKKHPEVLKLNGPEPLTKYVIFGVVALQLSLAYWLRDSTFKSWRFWLTAYVVGATVNSNFYLAIHELSHNLAFKRPIYNKLLAIFANLPVGIPYSAGFGSYHMLHHKHMGEVGVDTDLPTPLEAMLLNSVAGKAFFASFQLFFYALRPMFVRKMDITWVHITNIIAQVIADILIVKYWGIMSLYYMVISAFLAGSLHPIAGHFIAEHYILNPPKVYNPHNTPLPETFSYYGWLNVFVYNAGYHSEHHDFPYIPWTRIEKLRQIAFDFYDPLPQHTSWPKALVDFILDDDISLYNRVLRDKKVD